MIQLNLASVPDQALSATLNGVLFDLRIFLTANIMCCDLSINGVPVLTTQRLVAGSFIIPYGYLTNGNFLLTTLNDDLPDYNQFNATQFLIYVTQIELEGL